MNTHINLDKIKGTPIFKALSRLSVLYKPFSGHLFACGKLEF